MTAVAVGKIEQSMARATMEECFAVQTFLHQEAALLDAHGMRIWLDTMVHPNVVYQMVIRPELLKRDDRGECVWIYDDNFAALDLRINQFETGLQKMFDPLPRMARMITNIEVTYGAGLGQFEVKSYGLAIRWRREYEEEKIFYKRNDLLQYDKLKKLQISKRIIEIPQRVFTGKNLIIIL